jgi:predicted RNA-binding Zn-ribbon protein involved in translation (DUF1610 family)
MPKFIIIIAVVVVVIIFSAIRLALRSSSHHFKCPGCGENFQVSFFKYMFTTHSIDGKCSVTCPKCGKTNMLAPISGKK